LQGLIVKSTGSSFWAHTETGLIECHVKGNFRIRGIRSTNPVACGDHVEISVQSDGTAWITEILPRRNYIIRRSTNLSKESHILATNIDLAILLVTINHPKTSSTFVDRFLATCEAYRVPVCLVFNKIDLYSEDEQQELQKWRTLYESLGYPTYALSIKGETADSLLTQLPIQNKVVLLSGNSGVGKSTLINTLFCKELTRTGQISNAHDKGMHTTTFSEMYALPGGGWVIDTPGIKGFGTVDMHEEEIGHYFKEIFVAGQACRFSNCTHTGEPGCAVVKAIESGEIELSRFQSYLSMLDDFKQEKYR